MSGRGIRPAALGMLAALVVLLVGLVTMNYVVLTVAATAACLVLAGGLVWSGTELTDRLLIWPGVLLTVLTIMTRFFEYKTSLLMKSVAFTASGGVLIFVGLKIEGYLKKGRKAT